MIPNCKRTNEKEVFYWDGKSSTDNPDNIALWQEIIDTAATKSVLVYSSEVSELMSTRSAVIIINPGLADISSYSGSFTLNGFISDLSNMTTSSQGEKFSYTRMQVVISYGRSKITDVSGLKYVNRTSGCYLPTDKNTVRSYTPTYDYHPATKKYVDNVVSKSITLDEGGGYTAVAGITPTLYVNGGVCAMYGQIQKTVNVCSTPLVLIYLIYLILFLNLLILFLYSIMYLV